MNGRGGERKQQPGYYSRWIRRCNGWDEIVTRLVLPLKTPREIEQQLKASEQLAARLLIDSMASH